MDAEEVADREVETYGVAAGFAEDAFGETGGACWGGLASLLQDCIVGQQESTNV